MIFVELFLCHRAAKISYRNLSVFHSFGYPKILGIKGVGHDILSITFCLTVPKKIEEQSFRVSFNFGFGKKFMHKGGIS